MFLKIDELTKIFCGKRESPVEIVVKVANYSIKGSVASHLNANVCASCYCIWIHLC